MQLKHEAGEDAQSRKRFHMISKLRKAVKHTSNLDSIVRQSNRVITDNSLTLCRRVDFSSFSVPVWLDIVYPVE